MAGEDRERRVPTTVIVPNGAMMHAMGSFHLLDDDFVDDGNALIIIYRVY